MALVMALGVLLMLTLSVTATVSLASAGPRHAQRSNAGRSSHSLGEAGLNNALSVLGAAYETGTIALNDPPDLLPPRTNAYSRGTVTWQGEYCDGVATAVCKATDSLVWRLTSVATVTNPTGPDAADVTRRLTLRAPVELGPTKPAAATAWNWVYSGAGPTTPGLTFTTNRQLPRGDPATVGRLILALDALLAERPALSAAHFLKPLASS